MMKKIPFCFFSLIKNLVFLIINLYVINYILGYTRICTKNEGTTRGKTNSNTLPN